MEGEERDTVMGLALGYRTLCMAQPRVDHWKALSELGIFSRRRCYFTDKR